MLPPEAPGPISAAPASEELAEGSGPHRRPQRRTRSRPLAAVPAAPAEPAAAFAETDVIVGYNIAFDIDMLQAEYTRIGKPLLDLTGKKIVDALRLWQQCEPRSLQHAHQRFVGNGFAAAHSASADVAA